MSGWDHSILGKKFNRLTVLEFVGLNKHKKATFKCKCDCGNEGIYLGTEVKNGHTKSCGCYAKDVKTTHGMHDTKLYQTWSDMKSRCTNPLNKYYHCYGGRGITVCDRWKDEYGFKNFYEDMGDKPNSELSLERIDNNKGYSKENCYWATSKEQCRNLRKNKLITWNGETKCMSEWAEILNMDKSTLKHRLDNWSDLNEIMTKPVCENKLYTYNGDTKTIRWFEKKYGFKKGFINNRIKRGLSLEEAITKPSRNKTH